MKESIPILAIIACLLGCQQETSPTPNRKTVDVAVARTMPNHTPRTYSIMAHPYRTTELSFRVGGPVSQLDIQSGQYFTKGSLIAAIDPRDFTLNEQRARSLFEKAEADFHRQKALFEKENLPASKYEQAKAEYERAKTNLDECRNALADTRMYAPFDGFVQQVHIEQYSDVKATVPVVTFIDLSRVKVEAYVTEDLAARLRSQQTPAVNVCFTAFPDSVFRPSELFVSHHTAGNNLSYKLTAIIDNPAHLLSGGLSGSLILQDTIQTAHSANISIPRSSVGFSHEHGAYVWQIDKDCCVHRRSVKCDEAPDANYIIVTEGLNVNDRIVASGVHRLAENEKISIATIN